ncbi:MAG: Asp-tRNA(Asn)/Glu-tRNA(Gln) amidotransferase subunit GatA [Lachnospiraceae bacterium]|nr:Asp-tRNA(Asn)/Glu-tRNA(Gln) amidotransferase subunit GatA [Lachnospiraceae bacterium]
MSQSTELCRLTGLELSGLIRKRKISVKEALDSVFFAADKREAELGCYITLDREGAYAQGQALQKRIDAGDAMGILAGVPVAIKDNICTKGLRTTCGSAILRDHIAAYDAAVIERLKEHGCIITGKTNMDEFGLGATTTSSFFGPARNPADTKRITGGSSGGSAAAVASGEAFIALGSDTGGSVRNPACFCGITGVKPSYGRVSRYGLVAYASSMDQIGVLSRDTADAAAMLSVISGQDERDAGCLWQGPLEYGSLIKKELHPEKLRIGVLRSLTEEKAGSEVAACIDRAADAFRDMGAAVEELEMGYTDQLTAVYYMIADAECSSNLARYDGIRYGHRTDDVTKDYKELTARSRSEGFGTEVKRRIMAGCFALSEGYYEEYFEKAMKVRRLIKDEYDRAFERSDLILMPAAVSAAPLVDAPGDFMESYDNDIFTVGANLAGIPAASLPFGKSTEGLPVGIQLQAGYLREDKLFEGMAALEGYLKHREP